MRIMAGQTVCGLKWLALVRLDECRILGIMAVNAQCRGILGQVEIEFTLAALAGLMRYVAGTAPHIKGCMATAIFRDIEASLVTAQAKIRILIVACLGLQELRLILACVRVMAFDAITHCRRVNFPLDIGGFFVGVTGDAESNSSGSDELRSGHVSVNPDLVTTGTAHCNSRVYGFARGLIFVTLGTGCGILFRIKRDWMDTRPSPRAKRANQN